MDRILNTGLVPPKIVAVGTSGISADRLAAVDFKPIETIGDIESEAVADVRLYRDTMSEAELIQTVWLRNMQLGKNRVTEIVREVLSTPAGEEAKSVDPDYKGVTESVKEILKKLVAGVSAVDSVADDQCSMEDRYGISTRKGSH
jgi:hypothetical protein